MQNEGQVNEKMLIIKVGGNESIMINIDQREIAKKVRTGTGGNEIQYLFN